MGRTLAPSSSSSSSTRFSAFSIATYANRFDDYSGEEFEVDRRADAGRQRRRLIVKSQLVRNDGETVELDYLMRDDGGRWQASTSISAAR